MANTTRSTIVAVFKSSADAQAASSELKSSGIDNDDIYIGSATASATGGAAQSGYSEARETTHEGGIKGWWHSLFGSDEDTDRDRYESAVTGGRVLLSVNTTEDEADEVADILNRHSPVDVHEEGAGAGSYGASGGAATAAAATTGASAGVARATGAAGSAAANESGSIPVVEEELQIGKRSVQRGGVRVYSRVVEEPVEESIRLREEQVRVQRQAVDRPATEAELRGGQQQVIEVKEYAEEPVVAKQARVVEEVRVGKQSTERTETVRDTLRHTEVEVENLEDQNATASGDPAANLRAKSATPKP